jgi:adenylylsulfate kinase
MTEHGALDLIEGKDVVWHQTSITRTDRESANGHRGLVVWFTGLSGAGKSTLAQAVEEVLYRRGCRTFVLDGDNIRHGLCANLGFSLQDRQENLRRVGELARLFLEAGTISLAAFISPMRTHRDHVRQIVGQESFVEIFVSCPLEVCEQRDTKGMYRRARTGEIRDFTGISSPYEPPESPLLELDTSITSIDECVAQVLKIVVPKLRL